MTLLCEQWICCVGLNCRRNPNRGRETSENWKRNLNRGHSPRLSGGWVREGHRWASSQKTLKMFTWNCAIWCIVENFSFTTPTFLSLLPVFAQFRPEQSSGPAYPVFRLRFAFSPAIRFSHAIRFHETNILALLLIMQMQIWRCRCIILRVDVAQTLVNNSVILGVGLSVVLRCTRAYSAESAHTFEVCIVKWSCHRLRILSLWF